jgi:hypothetical protein
MVMAIVTCWPAETGVDDAILFTDVEPLELLYAQVSPTVVGNGSEPEDTTTGADEAELAPEEAGLAPDAVVAAVVPDPLEAPQPVMSRPAAAATTANAPTGRRASCA